MKMTPRVIIVTHVLNTYRVTHLNNHIISSLLGNQEIMAAESKSANARGYQFSCLELTYDTDVDSRVDRIIGGGGWEISGPVTKKIKDLV